MPAGFFQVKLAVKPKEGGGAELVPPQVLRRLNYHYVIVKDGGEEAIVKVEESSDALKKVEKDKNCVKLSRTEMRSLLDSYPAPKLKQQYRTPADNTQETGGGPSSLAVELDGKGERIVDKVQTVRAGFYLIDVPVLTSEP